MGEKDGTT